MKKKLSFLMALVAMWLYVGSVWAQETTVESPWTGVAIENGVTYYLYNVKAQAFLKGGNAWGTQASFGEDAVAFTAEGSGNLYGLKSTYGSYLGDGLYVDQAKKEFVFDEVGEGIYTIAKDGAYVGYDGGNIVVTAAEVNDGSYWQLLTKESIVADMVAADATTPYHVTALITCANFGRNDGSVSAWTGGPVRAGDNDNFCAEKWNAGISAVTQTLTGLPNGTYKLQAQGLYRMGGIAEAVALRDAGTEIYDVKFFANTDSVLVMSVMDEAGKLEGVGDAYGTYGAAPNNQSHASKFFNAGYYEHELYFTVTDGTAVIGVANNTGAGADWLVFDNFRLTYYGNVSVEEIESSKLQGYIDEVVALIAAAQAIETTYSEDAKVELDAAIVAGEAALATPTQDALVAAVAPLEAAIARAERSVAINAAASTATLTTPVAFTQFVTNPDMSELSINGWTATAGWQYQSNMVYTGEGVELNKFQEHWTGGTGLGNTSTMQVLKDMPNGIYRVSADVMATAQYNADHEGYTTGAYWVANQDSVAVATANEKPERVSVDVMVTDGVLNIGLVGVNTTANWMGLDNVTVIYYGAEGSLEDIDKQEYIEAFNVQCVELASLADTCSTIHLIPAVSERFFAVLEPAFAIYESVSVAPVDTLIYYTVLLQETAAYVKAMDAKYNEWKEVLMACYECQDTTTTASDEATAAFAEVVDKHSAYQWSMPAATVEDFDALIAELNSAREMFLTPDVPVVPEPILGDVNSDGQLTMSDVVMQVNAVLNIAQDNYDAEVADMNGDGQITVVDVVSVVRIVLGYESIAAARSMNRKASAVAIETGSAVAGSNGEIILPVYMNSEASYTAFQMDVVLPEGMSLTNATLGARAKSSHSIAWSTLDNGAIRIVAFAMDNATFDNNAESLAYLTLKPETAIADDAVLTLTEGLFVTANGTEKRADDAVWRAGEEPTGINGVATACRIYGAEGSVVVESATDAAVTVYTVTGQFVQQVQVKTGKNSIALSAGIYMVNNQKIIVK